MHAVRRNRSMGGRFVGKQNMDPNDEKVTPRESTQTMVSNIRHTVGITPTNILPTHTMIQIQNNMPVMSSAIQHSVAPVVVSATTELS